MKRLVIFDFDGTVVDTITDVGICFNQALAANGFPEHLLQNYSRFVGGNLETVVSRMLPTEQITTQNIDRVKKLYRQLYLESRKPNTKPYPGMIELLMALKEKGVVIAVNSNKGQALLDQMVKQLFPHEFFASVIGYEESRPSKPDPYGVMLICKECSCSPETAIYVGDGKSDIDTSQNAKVPCVLVHWGQGTEEDKSDPRVYAHVNTVKQLYEVLLA